MADFTALKSAIQTYIKQNGNEEITGEKLQEILLSVVTTLGDSAINDLVTALNDEVAARQNADGTLQQNITNEATARGNADTALGGRIDDEATARANGDTALSNRLGSSITAENTAADQIGAEAEVREAADTALQELIDGITDNIANGYVYAGIATPSSTPATGKVFYLALTAGTYTNFGSTVVSQGINILRYNGSAWSLDAFIGIDDELTAGSNNLPKSGNVLENIIKNGSAFDLSAYNAVDGVLATYADLDAALAALNLLPAVYKQGGMSVKFVQTSDNKYIQYRCIADSFTTDESQWVISEEGIYIDSPEFLWAHTDKDGRIFVAIKTDGSVYFGKGCPQQVVDYVTQHIDVILSSLSEKVDKVSGKSLIQTDVAENMEFKDYPYFIGATTDANGRILEDINIKGEKEINIPIETHSLGIRTIESTEWSQVILNNTGKVLAGRDKNGKAKEFVGLEATKIVADLLTANSTNARYINVKDELVLSKEATKKLKDALSLDQDLPDYYFDNDYIVNKARVINELWLNTGANADIFAFFTDAHYVNNAMITALLMKYLLCNSSISKVIYGGDTATNQSEDTIADVVAETQTAKAIIPYAKYFPVKGNHDYYDDNVTLPRSAVINNILNSCNVDGIVLNENDIAPYYYYDEKFSKTRYIVIDEYYDHAVLQVKSAQFSFLASALNGTPSGYSITIIAHTSIVNGTIHSTVEYDRAENLRNFINAFQNKTTVTIDGNTYDFTGATSKIVLFIAGHGHADMQNYLNDILYVSVPCSAMWGDIRYSPMYTYHEYPNRTKDTINEDCFDVVVLDKNNNVVNSIRIGDGFNRRFNLSPIEISVGNSETLVASISNIAQWLIHDSTGATYDSSKSYGTERWTFTNNVATITSEGIVTALSAGECYAIAITDNGDKEFFYIKVQ